MTVKFQTHRKQFRCLDRVLSLADEHDAETAEQQVAAVKAGLDAAEAAVNHQPHANERIKHS